MEECELVETLTTRMKFLARKERPFKELRKAHEDVETAFKAFVFANGINLAKTKMKDGNGEPKEELRAA